MNPLEKKFLYLFAFLILGTIITLQIRSVPRYSDKLSTVKVYRELEKQMESEKQLSSNLKAKIDENMEFREKLIKLGKGHKPEALLNELNWAKLLAGLTNVKGKGIEVLVNDAKVKAENPNFSIVHDTDILKILNELKVAGAQAVSVNGERILSVSEIVCTGPTVQVNRNRYAVPFEIRAIGDPDLLYAILNDSSIVGELRAFKIVVDIRKAESITILGFKGSTEIYINGLKEDVK